MTCNFFEYEKKTITFYFIFAIFSRLGIISRPLRVIVAKLKFLNRDRVLGSPSLLKRVQGGGRASVEGSTVYRRSRGLIERGSKYTQMGPRRSQKMITSFSCYIFRSASDTCGCLILRGSYFNKFGVHLNCT